MTTIKLWILKAGPPHLKTKTLKKQEQRPVFPLLFRSCHGQDLGVIFNSSLVLAPISHLSPTAGSYTCKAYPVLCIQQLY